MNLRLLARPAISLAVAIALWLAADLLWSVGMEIRETALNPACQLFQARVEMGLDCDSQNQFGFFLAIIAPFLGFGALVAFVYAITCFYKRGRHLFLCSRLAYHSKGEEWLVSGDTRHEFDVIGASAGDADFRRDQR